MEQKQMAFDGRSITYFEANTGNAKKILLMHGYSFNSQVWNRFGFIDFLNRLGYASFALDMPGFPNSINKGEMPESSMLSLVGAVIQTVIKDKPVLLGASASGYFVLKFAEENSKDICAVIAVGPVNLDSIRLDKIKVPILGIWGSNDSVADPEGGIEKLRQIGAKTVLLEGARHACYLDKPEDFKKEIADFVKSLK
ncbi:MAG: alpha/beta hydrolase [Candidatus Micrarchaeia archaeon]